MKKTPIVKAYDWFIPFKIALPILYILLRKANTSCLNDVYYYSDYNRTFLLSKFLHFLQSFNLSYHNGCGFCTWTCILLYYSSKRLSLQKLIFNSSHSISSFKLNQNSKLCWQCVIILFKVHGILKNRLNIWKRKCCNVGLMVFYLI